MSRAPSVRALAATANARLRSLADERAARQYSTYFKPEERIYLYGVRTPAIRAVEREIFSKTGGRWSVKEAIDFCQTLLRSRYLESKGVGLLLLERYRKQYPKDLVNRVRQWLTGGLCSNWATTDTLSASVLSALIARYPELVEEVKSWTDSPSLWLRRSAAVGLVVFARRGEHLDAAYDVAAALSGDREDLVHKAVGWLLREAGKKDPDRLKAFLLAHGPGVPRTAVRYAIERFQPEERKKLLAQTRRRA